MCVSVCACACACVYRVWSEGGLCGKVVPGVSWMEGQ